MYFEVLIFLSKCGLSLYRLLQRTLLFPIHTNLKVKDTAQPSYQSIKVGGMWPEFSVQ